MSKRLPQKLLETPVSSVPKTLYVHGKEPFVPLSEREYQTLALIAEGYATKHIAAQLNISKDTVETHRKNLLRKLGAENSAKAVATGFRTSLLK